MLMDTKTVALAHSRTGCSCNVLQYAAKSSQQQLKTFQQALQPMRLLLADQPFFGGFEPSYADFAVAGEFAVGFLTAPLTLNWRVITITGCYSEIRSSGSRHAVECISLNSYCPSSVQLHVWTRPQ